MPARCASARLSRHLHDEPKSSGTELDKAQEKPASACKANCTRGQPLLHIGLQRDFLNQVGQRETFMPARCASARLSRSAFMVSRNQVGQSCKATWKREFKLPWREAGPPNHHDDKVDSDQ